MTVIRGAVFAGFPGLSWCTIFEHKQLISIYFFINFTIQLH